MYQNHKDKEKAKNRHSIFQQLIFKICFVSLEFSKLIFNLIGEINTKYFINICRIKDHKKFFLWIYKRLEDVVEHMLEVFLLISLSDFQF